MAGDETSTCYTFFTQKQPDQFRAKPEGAGNSLPKILAPLEGDNGPNGRVYEYRQFLWHKPLDKDEKAGLKAACELRCPRRC